MVVYNGIIENFCEFCEELFVVGYGFIMEIDIEIIVFLM